VAIASTPLEVSLMKHSTTLSDPYRDLLIAVLAVLLTLLLWAALFAPAAV